MATDLERLVVTLEARTKEYERALAKAQNTTVSQLRKIERGMETSAKRQQTMFARMGSGIEGTMKRVTMALGTLGVGLSFAVLSRGITTAVSDLANLGEAAQQAGTSIAHLQALTSAGVAVGINQEELVNSIGRFNDRIGEAATKGGVLADILAANNVRIREGNGEFRDTADILLEVAELIRNAGSAQEQMVIATEAFGRSGMKLMPILAGGRGQLERMLQAAHDAGDVIDDKVVAAADRAVDKFNQFRHSMTTGIQAWLGNAIAGFEMLGVFGETELSQQHDIVKLRQEQADIMGRIGETIAKIREATDDGNLMGKAFHEEKLHAFQARLVEIANEIGRISSAIDAVNSKTIAPAGPRTQLPGASTTGGIISRQHDIGGGNTVRVSGTVDLNPKHIEDGVRSLERSAFHGFEQVVKSTDNVDNGVAETVSALDALNGIVDASGDRITGAIGHQTNALSSALESGFAKVEQVFSTGLNLSVGGAEQKQIDALARERDVISAGLQFKQLSPQDAAAAQHRLAEIDLQTAQLNQQMGEAKDALQSLTPMIFEMQTAGRSWAQITQTVAWEMKRLTGNTAITPLPLSPMRFAGGGEIHGPGGPKSDSVPIMASAGEFVVNAASTKKHRALLDAINGGRLAGMADGGIVGRLNGAVQRLANGGMVQAAPAGAGRREIHAPVSITVMAQDADSFRRSERDIGRQIAAEVEYHMQGR